MPLARRRPSAPPADPAAEGEARLAVTDGELLSLFSRHGDAAAFEALLARHAAMVWGVCRQLLRREQDAEDAFQATFLILARSAWRVGASESAAGWLYRVAFRTSLRARRRLARRREEALALDPAAPAEEEFPELWRRQLASVLAEELMTLPLKYQTPLVMRYLEGQSRRAIAEATDSTIQAVQGRLSRGKRLLRRRMVRRGVTLATAMTAMAAKPEAAAAAPQFVVLQTASNATAVATGGSLAASAAVVSLLHQGTRAMLAATISKPLAAAAACGLAAIALLANAQTPVASEKGFTLSAEVEEEQEAEAPTATLELAATDPPSDREPEALAPGVEAASDAAIEWRPGDENSIVRLRLHQERLRRAIEANMPVGKIDAYSVSNELVGAYQQVGQRLASLLAPDAFIESIRSSLGSPSKPPIGAATGNVPSPFRSREVLLDEARAKVRRVPLLDEPAAPHAASEPSVEELESLLGTLHTEHQSVLSDIEDPDRFAEEVKSGASKSPEAKALLEVYEAIREVQKRLKEAKLARARQAVAKARAMLGTSTSDSPESAVTDPPPYAVIVESVPESGAADVDPAGGTAGSSSTG